MKSNKEMFDQLMSLVHKKTNHSVTSWYIAEDVFSLVLPYNIQYVCRCVANECIAIDSLTWTSDIETISNVIKKDFYRQLEELGTDSSPNPTLPKEVLVDMKLFGVKADQVLRILTILEEE